MIKNIFILGFLFTGLTLNVFSQSQKISSTNFYSLIQQAEQKTFEKSRTEKESLEIYSNGVLKSTETEIEEHIIPNKQRYVSINKISNKTEKLELIKIGTNYYKRSNDGAWKKEKRWGRPVSFLTIPVPVSSEYSVENTMINNQPVKLYRYYAVYNEDNPKENEETQTYWDQKIWINKEGYKIREEIIVGKPQSKQIMSRRNREYKYDPNIKIVAPIK